VIVDGISETEVTDAIGKIREHHPHARLEALVSDLAKPAGTEETIRRFPTVDILVNNLGMYEEHPFEATSDADWQAIVEFNFMSGVRLCRHYLPHMLSAGWGRIIFLSRAMRDCLEGLLSMAGVRPKLLQTTVSSLSRSRPRIPAAVFFS
jgi:NAD(P)-dependent dehydrogenase (short-subunit alcohol dehydrogenase family)